MSRKYVGVLEHYDEYFEAETDEEVRDFAYRLSLDIEIYNRDHDDQKTLAISDTWPPAESPAVIIEE